MTQKNEFCSMFSHNLSSRRSVANTSRFVLNSANKFEQASGQMNLDLQVPHASHEQLFNHSFRQ